MLRQRGGKTYVYQSKRVSGRVQTLYLGRATAQGVRPPSSLGPASAELVEELLRHEAERSRARLRGRAALREAQAWTASLDAARAPLDTSARAAEVEALHGAGWARYHRGWRRGHMTTTTSTDHSTNPTPQRAPPKMPQAEREAAAEAERLDAKQAKREAKAEAVRQHAADLEAYRARLRASDAPELVRKARAMAPLAAPWAKALSAGDPVEQAFAEREAELLAAELAGPRPSAAVRLLAERCALDTLAVRFWERLEASSSRGFETLDVPEQFLRVAERLHRRLRQSVMALERVKAVQAAARAFEVKAPSPTPRRAPVLVLEAPPAVVH